MAGNFSKPERQRDRETERQRDRETDRETDCQIENQSVKECITKGPCKSYKAHLLLTTLSL